MTDVRNFAALGSRPDATIATVGRQLPSRTRQSAERCAGESGAGRPTVPSKTRLFSMQLRIARRQGTRSMTATRPARCTSNNGCSPLGGSTSSLRTTGENPPVAAASIRARDRRRNFRTCAPDRDEWPVRRAVERADSSDMLTRAYTAGISRGFEFFGNQQQTPRSQIRGPRGPESDAGSYTVGQRSADVACMARTKSGLWKSARRRSRSSRRGGRSFLEVAPSRRTSRTREQHGPSRFGVSWASERTGSERRGMGLAPTHAQMGLQKSAGWLLSGTTTSREPRNEE